MRCRSPFLSSILGTILLIASCGGKKEPPKEQVRVLGQAFIGPYEAVIRKEISPAAAEAAKLKHGDKVNLVERRRRFIRVQTAAGALGWIDSRQLLTQAQMDELAQLAAKNERSPRIGEATVYEPLNLHTEANRQSPSFAQIPASGRVDVIRYELAPRVPYKAPPLIAEPKPIPRPVRKKKEKEPKVEPPPRPAAPEPPDDWLELSTTPKGGDGPTPPIDQPVVRRDDWTLVRMADGKTGWALSSMVVMAIPDDVAQYSEGHRIMGYWPLAEVDDEGGRKTHWLWVTQSERGVPFDFDGFRIFMYSTKRHRYEQAYREKKLRGFFPVEVARPGSKKDHLAEFTIVTENDEGQKIERRFAFLGYRVLKLDERPWEPVKESGAPAVVEAGKAAPKNETGIPWYRRIFR